MSDDAVQGMDDELQSLLSDLEQEDSVVENISEDLPPDIVENSSTDIVIPDLEMSDAKIDMEEDEPDLLPIESTPMVLSDLKIIADKFDKDYTEVQANLKSDRKRIDTVIDILLARVRNNADAETDTMSLVKALAVLADTNGHAVKLLDSRSKLLSATKSTGSNTQNNISITGTDIELQKILDQPAAGDE
jgi:hypothetical protein